MRNLLAIDDQPTEDELQVLSYSDYFLSYKLWHQNMKYFLIFWQARTVIAENIPANYPLEDLEKLFRYLGRLRHLLFLKKANDENNPNGSEA